MRIDESYRSQKGHSDGGCIQLSRRIRHDYGERQRCGNYLQYGGFRRQCFGCPDRSVCGALCDSNVGDCGMVVRDTYEREPCSYSRYIGSGYRTSRRTRGHKRVRVDKVHLRACAVDAARVRIRLDSIEDHNACMPGNGQKKDDQIFRRSANCGRRHDGVHARSAGRTEVHGSVHARDIPCERAERCDYVPDTCMADASVQRRDGSRNIDRRLQDNKVGRYGYGQA